MHEQSHLLSFSHYQQYREYKYFTRTSHDIFDTFIENYEQLRKAVDQNIFSNYSRPQIQILDLLAVSNMADDDVESILEDLKSLNVMENSYAYVIKTIKEISDALTDLEEKDIGFKNDENDDDFKDTVQMQIQEEKSEITDAKDIINKLNPLQTFDLVVKNDEVDVSATESVNQYICYVCDKEFPKHSEMTIHRISHFKGSSSVADFKGFMKEPCTVCGKMISLRNKGMDKHKRRHKQKDLQQFLQCDQCDYKTVDKVGLKGHYALNHAPKDYFCDICSQRFGANRFLQAHINNMHSEKVKCTFCSFSSQKHLIEVHIKRRHKKSACNICSFCSYETDDKNALLEHVELNHPDENNIPKITNRRRKDYNCNLCDFQSNHKQSLRAHKSSKHWGIKYYCDLCDFKSTTKDKVKKHNEKIHLKIKHPCKFCNFQTADGGALRAHLIAKHPEFKLYSCHLCNYRTEKKDLLQRHLTGKYGKHGQLQLSTGYKREK